MIDSATPPTARWIIFPRMTGIEFAQTLARQLNLPPLEETEIAALLELASVAAHGSERLAAPLCTYLAGRSGRPLDDVHTAVNRLIDKSPPGG
jgi:hypothetical protein